MGSEMCIRDRYIPCDKSYLGPGQPGVPLDPSKPLQGPYGTGISGPIYGLCPTSRDWVKESSGDPLTGRDWVRVPPEAPKHLDDTDNVMRNIALKKLDAFAGTAHGFYFWVSLHWGVVVVVVMWSKFFWNTIYSHPCYLKLLIIMTCAELSHRLV